MFLLLWIIALSIVLFVSMGNHVSKADRVMRKIGMAALGLASFVLGSGCAAVFFGDSIYQIGLAGVACAGQAEEASGNDADAAAEDTVDDSVKAEVADPSELAELESSEATESEDAAAEPPESQENAIEIDYEARPAWVESPPDRTSAIHTTSVSSGPHVRKEDAARELDRKLKSATDDYIDEYVKHSGATRFAELNFDNAYIRGQLLDADHQFDEVLVFHDFVGKGGAQPMHQSHALLQFDNAFRGEIDSRYKDVVKTARLYKTGVIASGVMAFLATLLAYFKLDTATRGFYTGRLQFGTAAAILALIAAGVLLAKWIPWI